MNIFYLDTEPKLAAQYHCDKHVVKMILESAQLLSTAHRVLDGEETRKRSPAGLNLKHWEHPLDDVLYKASHVNHPCAIWVRSSNRAYMWLYNLFLELGKEYSTRYARQHATIGKLGHVLFALPVNIPITVLVPEVPQAMPEYCQVPNDPVAAYRNYYNNEKFSIAVWNNSEIPYWFNPKDMR